MVFIRFIWCFINNRISHSHFDWKYRDILAHPCSLESYMFSRYPHRTGLTSNLSHCNMLTHIIYRHILSQAHTHTHTHTPTHAHAHNHCAYSTLFPSKTISTHGTVEIVYYILHHSNNFPVIKNKHAQKTNKALSWHASI